jgi:hypothetical protein
MRLFYVLRQANHQTKSILSAIVGETNVSNGKSVLKFVYCEKATKKIENNLQLFDITYLVHNVKTKPRSFFKFLWPSQNI